MAAVAAQPVFRLLGAKDLGVSDDYMTEKMPAGERRHCSTASSRGGSTTAGTPTDRTGSTSFRGPTGSWRTRRPSATRVPADVGRPADGRRPRMSLAAHAAAARESASAAGIDVYFEGDSIVRRWGATDYPELLANWKRELLRLERGGFRLGRRPHARTSCGGWRTASSMASIRRSSCCSPARTTSARGPADDADGRRHHARAARRSSTCAARRRRTRRSS